MVAALKSPLMATMAPQKTSEQPRWLSLSSPQPFPHLSLHPQEVEDDDSDAELEAFLKKHAHKKGRGAKKSTAAGNASKKKAAPRKKK